MAKVYISSLRSSPSSLIKPCVCARYVLSSFQKLCHDTSPLPANQDTQASRVSKFKIPAMFHLLLLGTPIPHVLCVDTGRSSETAKAHRG
eukprot:TRINITY_DN6645_c0_g1_i1.p1 TRINITY_DN6645_c0_g1~~TRINITY_DN6645_c0_g1_i1.p1  ORF type:complete len:90 (+),score=6.80 TRINITY_DN6645_c0_g1_i1:88-357(+)